PAVSTSLGAEGIDYRDGSDILIADDPAAMARGIRTLLLDAELRAKLSANALLLAHGTYDWKKVGDTLLEGYESPSDTGAAKAI
ncbi:MAG: glycosyltransferase, partial [Fibrobacteria bacterium]